MDLREMITTGLLVTVSLNVYFGTKHNISLTVAAFGAMALIAMGVNP